jgi:hypothetical protein
LSIDNRELRKRLRDANSDLQRLVNEREKLMDISNMLKADLSRATTSQATDPLSRRPSDAALYDPSSASSRTVTPTPSSVQLLLGGGGGATSGGSRRTADEPLSPAAQGPTAVVIPSGSSQRLSTRGLTDSLISADDSEIDDLRLSRRVWIYTISLSSTYHVIELIVISNVNRFTDCNVKRLLK